MLYSAGFVTPVKISASLVFKRKLEIVSVSEPEAVSSQDLHSVGWVGTGTSVTFILNSETSKQVVLLIVWILT